MSSNDDADESIPLAQMGNVDALIKAYLIARLLGSAPDADEEQGEGSGAQAADETSAPPMPVPTVMPQPHRIPEPPPMPQPNHVPPVPPAPEFRVDGLPPFPHPPTSIPRPDVVQQGASAPNPPSNAPCQPSASTSRPTAGPAPKPGRPATPDDSHCARSTVTWRLFMAPLYSRLAGHLYDGKDSLLEPTTGNVSYLKLDGYGARDTVENMIDLTQYLQPRRWEEQLVDVFIDVQKAKPHWPAKLKDKPHADHVNYAWMLMDGLLSVIGLKLFLSPSPPRTFAGAVDSIFPPVPAGIAKPPRFSFSVRELVEEDFIIQPTPIMLDHLKLDGNAVSVYVLSTEQIQLLIGYDDNKVAKAIGLGNLGNEILQSYGALVHEEFREKYHLPISLGIFKIDEERVRRGQYDDLTVVSGIIEKKHKDPNPYHPPQLLASRVLAIEAELRRRRHWYNRLRRDIRKRKKAEPWMFWGTVLAVFFGVCTVIQTVTSVWSLIVALSQSP